MKKSTISHPGAKKEFYSRCKKCGACIAACPTHALKTSKKGFPAFHGPCVFCMECVRACPHGALEEFRIIAKAKIDTNLCAAWDNSQGHCLVCWEWCPKGAITLTAKIPAKRDPRDFVAKPSVVQKRCNGCGNCFMGCPHNAISLHRIAEKTKQQKFPRLVQKNKPDNRNKGKRDISQSH